MVRDVARKLATKSSGSATVSEPLDCFDGDAITDRCVLDKPRSGVVSAGLGAGHRGASETAVQLSLTLRSKSRQSRVTVGREL
jgi:hypothetical protein